MVCFTILAKTMKRTVQDLYDKSLTENSQNQKIRKEDQKSQVEVKGAAWCVCVGQGPGGGTWCAED